MNKYDQQTEAGHERRGVWNERGRRDGARETKEGTKRGEGKGNLNSSWEKWQGNTGIRS